MDRIGIGGVAQCGRCRRLRGGFGGQFRPRRGHARSQRTVGRVHCRCTTWTWRVRLLPVGIRSGTGSAPLQAVFLQAGPRWRGSFGIDSREHAVAPDRGYGRQRRHRRDQRWLRGVSGRDLRRRHRGDPSRHLQLHDQGRKRGGRGRDRNGDRQQPGWLDHSERSRERPFRSSWLRRPMPTPSVISSGQCDRDGGDSVPGVRIQQTPDALGAFSSRGPATFDVLKPDMTAPGVDILAVVCRYDPHRFRERRRPDERHLDGLATPGRCCRTGAPVRPTWTVPEVKSALMMTAHQGVLLEDQVTLPMPSGRAQAVSRSTARSTSGLVMNETKATLPCGQPGSGR